jgi:3-phosphoshikimate 1-carboxyvinyltransferase
MSSYFQGSASKPLRGTIRLPGDKSISHRALLFNAIARGTATIEQLLDSEDVLRTAECLRQLGVEIHDNKVTGRSGSLQAPNTALNCGNSGTTIRLLAGILAGQRFTSELYGDDSLHRRPMKRVTKPLSVLGASFDGPDKGERLPFTITGGRLQNCSIHSSVASAQVKTAVMLAGIQGEGTLLFSEPTCSRDHSERMFRAMGLDFEDWVESDGTHFIRIEGQQQLSTVDVVVPGDISSAAFFIVAATLIPGSDLRLHNVGLNPTRTGILDALLDMGAAIDISEEHTISGEPAGNIRVRYAPLTGTTVQGSIIPRMIDEIPILAVAAAKATGTTNVLDATELRVKESDRIEASLRLAQGLGAVGQTTANGFTVQGQNDKTRPSLTIDALNDHRVAMAGIIAGLVNPNGSTVSGIESIATSFPNFLQTIGTMCD